VERAPKRRRWVCRVEAVTRSDAVVVEDGMAEAGQTEGDLARRGVPGRGRDDQRSREKPGTRAHHTPASCRPAARGPVLALGDFLDVVPERLEKADFSLPGMI